MKIIKRIRHQTPEQKLSKFYLELGIVTKIILVLYPILALILLITSSVEAYTFRSFFSLRITEIIFFLLVGLTDLKRQQQKGSFFLLLTFIVKNIVLWVVHKSVAAFVEGWPEFGSFAITAIVIQYLFLVMVEDAFAEPERHKYLFVEPFQLKARFYPLGMFLLLMVTSMRVDLVVPFLLGVASHFGKVNIGASKISAKLNQLYFSQRLMGLGFIKEGLNNINRAKPLDELTTNDSIFLEQKVIEDLS